VGCFDLDISGDFELVTDNLEEVTFQSRGKGDVFTDHPCVTALRRARERGETGSPPVGSKVAQGTLTWHLTASDLIEGVEPKPRDRIVDDDGVVWIITKATLQTFSSRWRCETYKAVKAGSGSGG